jgi:hypothetical protein
MDESIRTAAISPLRQRLIDDMNTRRFSRETQRNYIRDVGHFATFLGTIGNDRSTFKSPIRATSSAWPKKDRQFQQRELQIAAGGSRPIAGPWRYFLMKSTKARSGGRSKRRPGLAAIEERTDQRSCKCSRNVRPA